MNEQDILALATKIVNGHREQGQIALLQKSVGNEVLMIGYLTEQVDYFTICKATEEGPAFQSLDLRGLATQVLAKIKELLAA